MSVFRLRHAIFVAAVLFSHACAMYVPGTFPAEFLPDAPMKVKVNSLTSTSTLQPIEYYKLPFCRPPEGILKSAENLGEMLMGDRIENSPYQFYMLREQRSVKLCDITLTEETASQLQKMISEQYKVNYILNNLPVTTNVLDEGEGEVSTGFFLGEEKAATVAELKGKGKKQTQPTKYIIKNHLVFNVLVHHVDRAQSAAVRNGEGEPGYTVVGFEIMPCSIHNTAVQNATSGGKGGLTPRGNIGDPRAVLPIDCFASRTQEVVAGETISFTYDVLFQKSNITWVTRWDAYLSMSGEQIHWFSILNSILVVCFLSGIVFFILIKTVRKDLSKYEEVAELLGEGSSRKGGAKIDHDLKEDSGWKLVAGDVFRPPAHKELLCVTVGTGIQVLAMSIFTLFFAALGFMSPANRGALLTTVVVVYLLCSCVGSFTSVQLLKTMNAGTLKSLDDAAAINKAGALRVAFKTAWLFPGIAGCVLAVLNVFISFAGSSGAVPLRVFFSLFFTWFLISAPLGLLGGYIASKTPTPECPSRPNQIQRQIPAQKVSKWITILGAGVLPFGTLFIELYFILSSIYAGRVYYVFGFLLVVLLLNLIVTAQVCIVLTYVQLCHEDYNWWWRSLFSGGSVAIYTMLYAISYLAMGPINITGLLGHVMFFSYTALISLGIFFISGSFGFLSSFTLTRYLFEKARID